MRGLEGSSPLKMGAGMAIVPRLILNNGVTVPQLGLGVLQVPQEETQSVVEDALSAGYRHIDTAAAYGNEAGVGAAIASSGIPLEEIFITTKLRNGEHATAAEAFEASRQALGVDVIDLYLIHWPVPSQGMFVEAWLALEKIYAAGGARAIGVSNFLQNHLDTLLAETTVVPAVNQFELHPTFQQAALSARSRALEIAVEAHSPLGRGTDLNAEAVIALAQVHGATPAQIVLGWHLGVGNIVIPKSANAHRLRENLAATEIILSQNELDAVTMMEAGARMGSDPDEAAFQPVIGRRLPAGGILGGTSLFRSAKLPRLGDLKPRSTGVGDGRLQDRVDRVVHGRRTRSAGSRSRRRCNKVESGGDTSSRWSDSGHWVHRPRAAWSILPPLVIA